jgi:hypothetical protein
MHLQALRHQIDSPVTGALKIRYHGFIRNIGHPNLGDPKIPVGDGHCEHGRLDGEEYPGLARSMIVRARITARTNGSKVHAHSLSLLGRISFPGSKRTKRVRWAKPSMEATSHDEQERSD